MAVSVALFIEVIPIMNLEQTKRVTAVFNELYEEIRQSLPDLFIELTEQEWKSLRTEATGIVFSYLKNAKQYNFNGLVSGIREFVLIRLLIMKTEHQRTAKQIQEKVVAVTPSLEELLSDDTKENDYEPYRYAG